MEVKKKIDLDAPLINFGPQAQWTVRAACEGTMILGGIGSGKTSGSYSFILRKFLEAGYGGLLLTVKPQEAEEYRKLCIAAGREKDLVVIEPGGEHSFNWLEYESLSTGDDKPITSNILEVLKTCIKAGAEKEVGRGDDGFWQQSLDLLIGHVIDLMILAFDKVTIENMYHVIQTLPKNLPPTVNKDEGERELNAFEIAWATAVKNVNAKRHKWHSSLTDEQRAKKLSKEAFEEMLHDAVPEVRLLNFLAEFFFDSFKTLSPKTRSIIEFIFSGFLYSLLKEPVYSLFSKKPSTVVPEDCFNKSKIILINLPVKKYHETGRNVQLMVKYICQRAWEKREINDTAMPLFLASDEAYTFCHEHDALFNLTARSSRVCNLAVSQNLSNYYAAMGGDAAKYRVNTLISTLATKIFHANTDVDTNEYASGLVGDAYFRDTSVNMSMAPDSVSHGQSSAMKREKIYHPEFFHSLKCGGPRNGLNVEGIIHKQGDPISGNKNYALVNFKQSNK